MNLLGRKKQDVHKKRHDTFASKSADIRVKSQVLILHKKSVSRRSPSIDMPYVLPERGRESTKS